MIFEMRTYTLKPGTVPQAEQAFADKIAERVKLSPLAGFWRTEVGTLNQIIHIWPYKDINERDQDPRRGRRDEGLAAGDRRLRARHGEQDPPSARPSRRTSSRASTAASTSSAPTPTGRRRSPR